MNKLKKDLRTSIPIGMDVYKRKDKKMENINDTKVSELIAVNSTKPLDMNEIEKELWVGKELKRIFEKNFFTTGLFEISNVELAKVAGKEVFTVNRDLKREFSHIFNHYNQFTNKMQDHDFIVMKKGMERLISGLRLEEELDERNRPRQVYYLSGLALTQILSRWDPIIRFLINSTIHELQEQLVKKGYRAYTMSDFTKYCWEIFELAGQMEITYALLAKDAKVPHIKDNYQCIVTEMERIKNDIKFIMRKEKDNFPELTKLAEEIKAIDENCANIIAQKEMEKKFEDKDLAKIAYENQ